MEQRNYQPTEKQEQKWAALKPWTMPTDDEFKTIWMRKHHGKQTGWGLEKRQWIIQNLSSTREYQMGLWQGRVDFVRGLTYQDKHVDDENANSYNLGYYRGYTNCESDMHGMDTESRNRLNSYKEN
jgi:hypothetical protein